MEGLDGLLIQAAKAVAYYIALVVLIVLEETGHISALGRDSA